MYLRTSSRFLKVAKKASAATPKSASVDFAEPAPAVEAAKVTKVKATAVPATSAASAVARGSAQAAARATVKPDFQASTLKNGLTVITRDSPDNVDHAGFFLKAGPAYLTSTERGYAQVLAYALTRTNKLNSTFGLVKAFAANQSTSKANVIGRQLVSLTSDGLPEDLDYLLDTFTTALFMPSFQSWEINDSMKYYKEHVKPKMLKEGPAPHVEDLIFQAAFGNDGLAEPTVLPDYLLKTGVNVDVLANVWQKACNLNSIAFVGQSTYTHGAVVDRLQANEDVLRNESATAQPVAAATEFRAGIVTDYYSRSGFGTSHGSSAVYGGLGFTAPAGSDAVGSAAARVLIEHPKIRALRGVHFNEAVAKYTGFSGAGLISVVSAGVCPLALQATHAVIQGVFADAAAGVGLESLEAMKLAAQIRNTSTRASAVDALALQWAAGLSADHASVVTAADVTAVAKAASRAGPAVAYHGDVANISRESLVQ